MIDIGEPAQPPRTLFDLLDLASEETGTRLQVALDACQIGWIIVRYTRRGHEGVLTLQVTYEPEPTLTATRSAGASAGARALRSGPDAASLAGAKVLIVGLGGIGSFTADELARAGVRSMTLLDGDVLLPGNLVRHLLGDDSVGRNKADAMERRLNGVRGLDPESVTAIQKNLSGLDEAVQLLELHDIAVDATGSDPVASLLAMAAELLDKPVVSAATTQDGRVVRVDRFPLAPGETHVPDPLLPRSPHPPLYDSGCGSPVSPTPPWAVSLAAAHAARTVIGLLTEMTSPPSFVETVCSTEATMEPST